MRRRTPFALAVTAVALCAALSACGDTEAAPSTDAVASAAPTPTATAPADPYAFTYVPYPSYSEAARQTGIRPDLVVHEDGFSAGVATLCRATPGDLSALLDRLRSASSAEDDPNNALQAMIDEVSLRVDLSCPQRMSDWIAAGGGSPRVHDDGYADPAGTGSTGSTAEPSDTNFGPASLDGIDAGDIGEAGDAGDADGATSGDSGSTDSGSTDSGSTDSGSTDSGSGDTGS